MPVATQTLQGLKLPFFGRSLSELKLRPPRPGVLRLLNIARTGAIPALSHAHKQPHSRRGFRGQVGAIPWAIQGGHFFIWREPWGWILCQLPIGHDKHYRTRLSRGFPAPLRPPEGQERRRLAPQEAGSSAEKPLGITTEVSGEPRSKMRSALVQPRLDSRFRGNDRLDHEGLEARETPAVGRQQRITREGHGGRCGAVSFNSVPPW